MAYGPHATDTPWFECYVTFVVTPPRGFRQKTISVFAHVKVRRGRLGGLLLDSLLLGGRLLCGRGN